MIVKARIAALGGRRKSFSPRTEQTLGKKGPDREKALIFAAGERGDPTAGMFQRGT